MFPHLASCEFIEIDPPVNKPLTASLGSLGILVCRRDRALGRQEDTTMVAVIRTTNYVGKVHTHNNKMILSVVAAAIFGVIGFNLDVPANWLFANGRGDVATPCYQLMSSFSGDLHISNARTADALSNLAQCYAKDDRLDEAIKTEQQAINMYKESLGADSTQVFIGMARLGQYLNQKGNYVRAEMILTDAEQGLERSQVPDTEAVALVYANLADTLVGEGKEYPAINVLQKLQPIDERLMLAKQYSVNSHERLASIYERQGHANLSRQTAEAGKLLQERLLGARHK